MIGTYALAALSGTLLGFLIGFMPGVSITAILIMGYAFLIGHDLMTLLILYACMVSAAHYSGSISALYLGVPGETNSLPLVTLRHDLMITNNTARTVVLTCVGSCLVAVASVIVAVVGIQSLSDFESYLRSWVLAAMGMLGIMLSMFFSDNKFLVSAVLAAVGWIMGKVGTDPLTMQGFMTFGNDYLSGGIPTITVLLGLFAVPCLARSLQQKPCDLTQSQAHDMKFDLGDTMAHLPVMARSGAIGFVAGVIPYIGVAISSNLAYHLEKWRSPKDPVRQAVAAESANNASSISVLIPFVTFGVAIASGEAVLSDIMAQNGLVLGLSSVDMVMLTVMLLASNIVCIGLAWPLAKRFSRFYADNQKLIMVCVILLCLYTVMYMGAQMAQAGYFVVCLAVLSTIGYALRGIDTLPLIFAFLLQGNLEPALIRSMNILMHVFQI
jgi:putative tricarboxylic transport membrane protein